MKNSKLIYLIPAMMLLVGGCTERTPEDTNEDENRELSSPGFLPGTYCIDLNDFDFAQFWNSSFPSQATTTVNITQMSPAPTGSITSSHQPYLTSFQTTSNTEFQVVFKLKNLSIVPISGNSAAEVKYYADLKMLAVLIDVTSSNNTSEYYQLYGNSGFIHEYNNNLVSSVVAVIRYPDGTTRNYNYVVDQLTACNNYPTTVSPAPLPTAFLNKIDYQSNLGYDDVAHIYATTDITKTTIATVGLFVPVQQGKGLNNLSWILQHDGDDNYRVQLEATAVTDAHNKKGYVYHYFGDLGELVGVPSGRYLTEVEIIIIDYTTNPPVRKPVKIIVQSTDDHGLVNFIQPTDSTGRINIK